MLRKRRSLDANFDPLMDILISVVGIMVIIVLFAVISARGKMISKDVTVKVVAPMLRVPASGVTSKIFLCRSDKIYYFGIEEGIEKMVGGIYANDLDTLISKANKKNVKDEYFKYKLAGISRYNLADINRKNPVVILIVDLIKDSGETLEDLAKGNSLFINKIRQFEKGRNWIHFLVDKKSFEVFNLAKEIAEEEGFSMGWDPVSISFPYKECLEGCDEVGASGFQVIKGINILGR